MAIRCLVWGENIHERESKDVAAIYPLGMHRTIATALNAEPAISATTATLQEADHGCSAEVLARTDVLVWWGHAAHEAVADAVVERIVQQVWTGMGLVVLHSAHFSKLFLRLMGSPCALKWREAGELERVWVVHPTHPIARGLPSYFELEHEEMYCEPFSVPEPLETVFISWFRGGEVFRSGLTYQRGAGKIFYFRPGHETYPTYHDKNVQKVLQNAVQWAVQPKRWASITDAPNVAVEQALEPISEREPKTHESGKASFR
ncbi:MAG: ThuA domain-containing protein [Steroidobacteraceae bacterium]